MKVAVLGGTGHAGRATVDALRASGHEPVVLARSSGVDVVTGEGLAAGLAGADAVVDVTNVQTTSAKKATPFFEAAARNLVRAAEEAGVGHVVALSIVGIDRVPFGYYQGKVRQEEVLSTSQVPVSIVRATQFHEFAGQYLARSRGPLVPVPRWRVQPVAVREVGEVLARTATGGPIGTAELAGPQEERMADLLRALLRARGERRWVVEVRLPGQAGRAMAAGGSLPGGSGMRGTQPFAAWLAEQPR